MLKKYFGKVFPITIGLPDTESDAKRIKKDIGEIFLSYLKYSKNLNRFFLSVPDWEIGEPYAIESGNMGDPLILFSDGWEKEEKHSISKSLLLLDEHIWRKTKKSATEMIMTNLKGPILARIDRIDPFNFKIAKFDKIKNETTSCIETADLSETLYPFINSIQMIDRQKEDINSNQLTMREFGEQILESAKKQFIFKKQYGGTIVEEAFDPTIKNTKEIDKIKDSFDEAIQALTTQVKGDEAIILWAFWKSLLYFYKDNGKYINPNHIFYLTLPVYKKRDGKQVSPFCFILVVWDKLDNDFNLIDDEAFYDFIYLVISQWALLDNFKVARKSLRSQLLKSAIAAIMSRNGSHNIGSHVLAAVGNNYNDLPDDQILFKYIQHRMDYIAQIATEFPNWTYPTWFIRDLMRRFYMQRHLLNYVANSEGLNAYEFQPKEKNKDQRNKIIIKIFKKGYGKKYIISPEVDGDEQPEIKDDIQIAIPGGIIGHQAFYTIIENIIRNAAKHGWSSLKQDERPENLEITIEIVDKKNRDFIIFRIWDNVSNMDEDFISEINTKLSKSFVNQESGKLLKSNWGLAEMKISAGFLNRRDILQIGSDNEDDIFFHLYGTGGKYSGIIRAIPPEGKYSFGYEFAIPKPKEVLLIGLEKDGLDESLLQQNSIYLEDESTDNTSFDYEFVVLYDCGKNDFINKLKDYKNKSTEVRSEIERFPFRLFIVSGNSELIPESGFLSNRIVLLSKDDIKLGNAGELIAFKLLLYKKWVRHLMKRRGIPKDKNLRMLINLSGDPGHSKEDIVKLIFYRFKDSLLKEFSEQEFNIAKDLLRNVTDSDIDGYKPYDDSYADSSDLINNWARLAITKVSNILDEQKKSVNKLRDALKKPAKIHFEILKDMYVRYDEDIQTLPKNYRGQSSTATGDLKGLCIDDGISISITYNEDDKNPPFDIAYNRHSAKIASAYYTEALSGAQIYFSLLQNLATESDYNKSKMILQLVENALLRVVIIDERVAQYYSNCSDVIKDRFDKGNFKIPLRIKVGDSPDGKSELVKNTDSSEDYLIIDEIPSDTYDVFIIHQGILDKIGPTDPSELKELIDTIKESVPFLIITSGRGEPESIPDNAKFLPFSNIESFVLSDFPEKYLLTQMAMKIIT